MTEPWQLVALVGLALLTTLLGRRLALLWHLGHRGRLAQGVVTEDAGPRHSQPYRVKYVAGGRRYEGYSWSWQLFEPEYFVGEQVTVCYAPRRPDRFVLTYRGLRYQLALALVAAALSGTGTLLGLLAWAVWQAR